MRSDALSVVKDCEHRGSRANLHELPGQRIRHAVEVVINLDVIVAMLTRALVQ